MHEMVVVALLLFFVSTCSFIHSWYSERAEFFRPVSTSTAIFALLVFISFILLAGRFGIVIYELFEFHCPVYPELFRAVAAVLSVLFFLFILGLGNTIAGSKARRERNASLLAKGKLGGIYAYSKQANGEYVDEGEFKRDEALMFARRHYEKFSWLDRNDGDPLEDAMIGFYRTLENVLDIRFFSKEWGTDIYYAWEEEDDHEIQSAPEEFVMLCIEKFYDLSSEEFFEFFKKEGAGPLE